MNEVARVGNSAPARRQTVLTAVLVTLVLVSLVLLGVAVRPQPAQAVGELWHGTIEWKGTGVVNFGGGITYTNNDEYRLEAPSSSENGAIKSTINTTITYPPPALGGCYMKKEAFRGEGISAASFTVDTAGNFYTIHASTVDNVPVLHSVVYGGGVLTDGTVCADSDSTEGTSIGPFVDIQSWQNPLPKFRVGSSVTPSLQLVGGCAFYGDGLQECADMQSFKYWPGVSAKWSLAINECSGYSNSWNIGADDKLVLFNVCQAKSLSSRTSALDDVSGTPKVCAYTFTKLASRLCTVHKSVVRTQWAQNDWFMFNAANTGSCGVWVVDGASWRPPKIKPATNNADGLNVAYISPGTTVRIRTSSGSIPVTCPG